MSLIGENNHSADTEDIDSLNNEDVKRFIDKGYRYKHKSLEEYVALSGKNIIASEEIDYGPPVGDEVW